MNFTTYHSSITTNRTTTAMPASAIWTPELMHIIIGSLAGTLVLLVVILTAIFCCRKKQKLQLESTIMTSSGGPQTNLSFEDELDNDPVYRASPDIEDSPHSPISYLTTNDGRPQMLVTEKQDRRSYDAVDLRCPIPVDIRCPIPRQSLNSQMSDAADYENAEGLVYENCNKIVRSPTKPLQSPNQATEQSLSPTHEKESNLFRQGTKAYHLYSNAVQNYEMSPKQLIKHKQIGKGHFSTVYSGVAIKLPYSKDTDNPVAIKTLKSSASDSDKQEFLYEFEIMKLTNSLNHDNITRLLGSITKSQPCMIVLELMPNGNLRNFLRDTRSQDVYYNLHGDSNSLSERQLLQFGLDIANGMEGIADLQLLHRDLAARNILLDSNLRCKISDFGFAKDILNKPEYKSRSVLRRARPIRWLAPESVLMFKHSIQSDVWSYGIVLWEIVTLGNLPYPTMKVKEVQHALTKKYRMSCPAHCSPDLYRVMACCWEENPKKRPPFHQLVDKMRKLLEDATRLIDIERMEDHDYIDVLPPDELEMFVDYTSESSVA